MNIRWPSGLLLPQFPRRVPSDVCLDTIEFTPQLIIKAIGSCKKVSKSCDPDGFNLRTISKLRHSLANPMCILFNWVFNNGSIPDAWKTANVTPIFKKGLSSSICNYRPISLTSVFSKLFERIVKDQMLKYLFDHKLITRCQHGFLSKHSTCTQLLETVNDWSIALFNRHTVDAVYFDFAKAFDTVSHPKLIYKLSAYGFSGKLLNCISDFLCGRVQRVVLPNGSSSFQSVFSGVPQGSVLGPLLFLIYVNDIADLFVNNVAIKLFADDIKIYLEIENESDFDIFQQSINSVSSWAKTWQLNLAVNKCFHMRVTLSKSIAPHEYFLNDSALPLNVCCRDLGVTVDSQLSFSSHINSVVASAQLRSSQILHCFFISRSGYFN